MLPRIRHNNFIGAVELFVKSSYTKTHSNNFFNNIHHAFKKKDWISNYDSLLTLRSSFVAQLRLIKVVIRCFHQKMKLFTPWISFLSVSALKITVPNIQ